jgi:hypothetical protein
MVDAKFAPPAPAATPTPAPETPPATPPETPPATLNIEAAPNAKPKTGFDSLEKDWTPELEAKLRKLYPEHKMWRVKDVVESKYKSSESQLTAKLAELEARRQTPANDEKIEQLQKLIEDRDQRLKERDQRLEEADFTLGQTYAKFVSRFNTEKLEALDVVKSLAVTYTDPEGETKTRQATDSDFNQALNISDPAAQDDFIEKTFGRSAWRVTNHINELNRIRRDAKQAKDDFAANFEKNKVERELAAKRQEQEYEGHFNEAFKGLSSDPDLGSYVSESEADPEGTALLKAELNKFDSFKTEMAKMNPKDRAGAVALVRARFGGAPRAIAELKKERAKIAELEAKIAKLIGTDPGQQVKTVTGGPAATEAKGIEGMVGALKWDGSK